MTRFRRGLILSVLLHVGFIAWLLLTPPPETPPAPLAISIETREVAPIDNPINESVSPSKKPVAKRQDSPSSRAARMAGRPGAKEFLDWKSSWLDRAIADSDGTHSEERIARDEHREVDRHWTDPWSYQPEASFHDRFTWTDRKVDGFFSALHRQIDDNLRGHPMLAAYNHSGTVFLKFAVDHRGRLIGDSLSAYAEDAILKVYSARALRRGLDVDLPQDLHLERDEPIWLSARFEWVPTDVCRPLAPRAGPFFTFCRESHEGQKDLGVGGHVAEAYNMALNFDEIPARLKALRQEKFRRATNFDPFANDRRDPDYQL